MVPLVGAGLLAELRQAVHPKSSFFSMRTGRPTKSSCSVPREALCSPPVELHTGYKSSTRGYMSSNSRRGAPLLSCRGDGRKHVCLSICFCYSRGSRCPTGGRGEWHRTLARLTGMFFQKRVNGWLSSLPPSRRPYSSSSYKKIQL